MPAGVGVRFAGVKAAENVTGWLTDVGLAPEVRLIPSAPLFTAWVIVADVLLLKLLSLEVYCAKTLNVPPVLKVREQLATVPVGDTVRGVVQVPVGAGTALVENVTVPCG